MPSFIKFCESYQDTWSWDDEKAKAFQSLADNVSNFYYMPKYIKLNLC